MIFMRIFIVSLFIVYSNKYSFEQCSEILSNETGLTNLSNILIAAFIEFKRKYEFRVFLKVAITIIAMSVGAICGATHFLFRKKASQFQKRGDDEKKNAYENVKEAENWRNGSSGGVSADFVSMTEFQNKISCLRDLLDFPPCLASATLLELLILTLSDIFQRYPEIKPVSEFRDAPFHKALKIFCDSLNSLGDLWTTEEWMVQCRYDSCMRLENAELERIAVLMLEDIIPVVRERLFNEMDDDDYDDYSPPANPFSKALFDNFSDTSSFPGSPMTPTSVLPGSWRSSSSPQKKGSYSPPVVLPFRVQAVGKLSPIDVKRLSFHMLPHIQDPKCNILMQDDGVMGDMEMIDVVIHTPEMEACVESFNKIVNLLPSPRSLPKLPPNVADAVVPLPLLQPVLLPENEPVSPTHDKVVSVPFPPPPPSPLTVPRNLAVSPPPPPPPPPTSTSKSSVPLPPQMSMGNSATPAPPPPPMRGNGPALPPPPPPICCTSMPKGSGSAPPPPPGAAALRTKKMSSKLKRSSQMSKLYRTLKGKVEGSSSPGKSRGRKSKVVEASSPGGKQGMADALAEMTKRSSYFLQIEEDVKTYEGVINKLKTAIASFQTSDMAELQKFRKHAESYLEKLTDETQVLARFEDFPSKKLEAIRMASSLHLKLDSIVATLENWQIVGPIGKLLDRAEGYFSKIKVELDALERTKDEDMKRFQAQKINFDFGILTRIKELMVDVSSSCMELALKERRQVAAEGKNGTAKILWRAFQFAFRVYTFAGGHDDRADELTREVAHEIETQN